MHETRLKWIQLQRRFLPAKSFLLGLRWVNILILVEQLNQLNLAFHSLAFRFEKVR